MLLRLLRRTCIRNHNVRRPFCTSHPDELTHEEVIQIFKDQGLIKSRRVLDACLAINPRLFAASSPEEEGEGATADTQATAEDAANAMIAYIVTLELLEQSLADGKNALDLGTGTGFTAACMAHMVGPVGRVVSLDKNKYNQDSAIETIGIHYPHLLRRIEFHEKNVFEGFPEAAPYDAIHVGAAVFSIPSSWVKQMVVGGVMTVPVVVQSMKEGKVIVELKDPEQPQKLYRLEKTSENNEYTLGEVMDVKYDFFSSTPKE